jgi:hypothetical protein
VLRKDTYYPRSATRAQDFSAGSHILPDRVTLQPSFRTQRTPFDKYKASRGDSAPEVNPSTLAAKRLGISELEFEDALTKEINELLSEIEEVILAAQRHTNEDSASALNSLDAAERGNSCDSYQQAEEAAQEVWKTDLPNQGAQRASPPKRCYPNDKNESHHLLEKSGRLLKVTSDPRARRGRVKKRTSTPVRRDPPPPPPLDRTPSPTRDDEQGLPILTVGKRYGQGTADSTWPPRSHDQVQVQVEEDSITVLPDRPTFFHFSPVKRSPFAHYLKTPIEARPSPVFPTHRRLGLTEEAFEVRLKAEIDEFLLTAEAECRRDKEPVNNPPSSSVPSQTLPVLSKDEAFRFVEALGFPKTGPLLGVAWWAADIGRTRFNFDFNFDRDDLSILNAYD